MSSSRSDLSRVDTKERPDTRTVPGLIEAVEPGLVEANHPLRQSKIPCHALAEKEEIGNWYDKRAAPDPPF
ncbi:hypothetical protein NDU88_004541 [Pleurodeles waltl]|uniref:Uncharacterized protein n=1 Tax=Pleurodeles waltl TaxID=8319 RepID=A0AAV7PCT8_PLEWA|nr:hypothetical protein NDU88_004541 [Pleurodeles waltl]